MGKVVIKMSDNIINGIRAKEMITKNDTIFEVDFTNAKLAKLLEFCVGEEFSAPGSIVVEVPFALSNEDAQTVKRIIQSIKTDKDCEFVDFTKAPPTGKSRSAYTQLYLEEYEDGIEPKTSEYSVLKSSKYLEELGNIYMPVFMQYIDLSKLKSM